MIGVIIADLLLQPAIVGAWTLIIFSVFEKLFTLRRPDLLLASGIALRLFTPIWYIVRQKNWPRSAAGNILLLVVLPGVQGMATAYFDGMTKNPVANIFWAGFIAYFIYNIIHFLLVLFALLIIVAKNMNGKGKN